MPAPPSQDPVSEHANTKTHTHTYTRKQAAKVWFGWIQWCRCFTRGQHNTDNSLLVWSRSLRKSVRLKIVPMLFPLTKRRSALKPIMQQQKYFCIYYRSCMLCRYMAYSLFCQYCLILILMFVYVCVYVCVCIRGCVRLIHNVGWWSLNTLWNKKKLRFFFPLFFPQAGNTPRWCHVQDVTVPLHTTGGRQRTQLRFKKKKMFMVLAFKQSWFLSCGGADARIRV